MKNRVLLVTDFYYRAKGREYFREDLDLSQYLKSKFTVCIAHIEDCLELAEHVDVVLLRNTGPKALHKDHLANLQAKTHLRLFNDLLGKGDITGKTHLLELYKMGYPVIPSYTCKQDIEDTCGQYLLKPLDGADSIGMQFVTWDNMQQYYPNMVLQPVVELEYEVSFYFINDTFYYALYAPFSRWNLEPYIPSKQDLAFAEQFISWNSCRRGIQRVDAGRLKDGRLLLMELEDYNPFLSLELLKPEVKNNFLDGLSRALVS